MTLLRLVIAALLAWACGTAFAAPAERDITTEAKYWVDESGRRTIQEVADGGVAALKPMERHQPFQLGETGALWMGFDVEALDSSYRWYLILSGAAYINRVSLFTRGSDGLWREQMAGDHVPVARWPEPNDAPLFAVQGGQAQQVWLRLENRPAPVSPFVQLLTEQNLQLKRQWTWLLLGGYVGFGLLVLVLGLMHARLYRDRVFHVYCLYVACMLVFQVSYTGIGGLFLWPHSAWLNDVVPATFVLWMAAAGIWFNREATALSRHSPFADRVVLAFCLFGLVFPIPYAVFNGAGVSRVLNVYALMSVVISIAMCLWTWRKGERYSLWLFFGFLPVHLGYPFPALRAAGMLPDSWASQYAVLIGSAIEIPLLLYILHARAKDFSENSARMRALDTTDPLTGLTISPVLRLRVRDALRRSRRLGQRFSVLLVELANHADIVQREGREAGDRALVVAASRLTSVVRDVDTVCRIADTRFAILSEGPQQEEQRRHLAQHIVARGLERVYQLPKDVSLSFRVVSAWVPDEVLDNSPDPSVDEQRVMQRLEAAMDRLLENARPVVHHLEPRRAQNTTPAAMAA